MISANKLDKHLINSIDKIIETFNDDYIWYGNFVVSKISSHLLYRDDIKIK